MRFLLSGHIKFPQRWTQSVRALVGTRLHAEQHDTLMAEAIVYHLKGDLSGHGEAVGDVGLLLVVGPSSSPAPHSGSQLAAPACTSPLTTDQLADPLRAEGTQGRKRGFSAACLLFQCNGTRWHFCLCCSKHQIILFKNSRETSLSRNLDLVTQQNAQTIL